MTRKTREEKFSRRKEMSVLSNCAERSNEGRNRKWPLMLWLCFLKSVLIF